MKVKSTRCCPFLFVNRGQPPLGWKGGEGSEGREAEGVPVSQLDPGTRELEARARELEVLASPPPKLPSSRKSAPVPRSSSRAPSEDATVRESPGEDCPGQSEVCSSPLTGSDWGPTGDGALAVRGGRVQCRVQCLSERGEFRPELDLFRGSPALPRPFGLSPRGPALPQSDPV